MPIYEFECVSCGKRFEELMRLSDPDPAHCPCDRHEPVRRRVSAPQFRLAGSGWYETDFKSDKDSRRNLAGDGAESRTDGAAKDGAAAQPAAAGGTEKPAAAGGTEKPAAAPSAPSGSAAGAA